jgi:hypothetical protein
MTSENHNTITIIVVNNLFMNLWNNMQKNSLKNGQQIFYLCKKCVNCFSIILIKNGKIINS